MNTGRPPELSAEFSDILSAHTANAPFASSRGAGGGRYDPSSRSQGVNSDKWSRDRYNPNDRSPPTSAVNGSGRHHNNNGGYHRNNNRQPAEESLPPVAPLKLDPNRYQAKLPHPPSEDVIRTVRVCPPSVRVRQFMPFSSFCLIVPSCVDCLLMHTKG